MEQRVSLVTGCCESIDEIISPLDEVFEHPAFSNYRLRITEPKLCDPDVKQYSGYFDIADGKHLFFWQVSSKFLR